MDGSSTGARSFLRWMCIIVLIVAGSVIVNLVMNRGSDKTTTNSNAEDTGTSQVIDPLEGVASVQGTTQKTLKLSGDLVVDKGLVLSPQAQPVSAVAGQLYFDGATHELNYYNGTQFVALTSGGTSTTTVIKQTGSTLSVPLTVAQGGTGVTSLSANGVIVGNGTNAVSSVTASATGLCLVSTASGPAFDTCPGVSASSVFLQNGNSFGAGAVLGTNDAFGLQFEVNNQAVASLSATGAASFQNASNSTSAFAVLNVLGVSQLTVDSQNSRVYIGNATDDTVGTLLVLDSKNTASDPTGVAGAMYYNSSLAQSRCYDVNYWRDCGLPSVRGTYYYLNDFMGIGSDSSLTLDVAGGGFGTHTSVPGHPGIVYADTGSSTTARLWVAPRQSGGNGGVRFGTDAWRHETVMRFPAASSALSDGTNPYTFRSGFFDDASVNGGNGVDGCFFRYSHSINSGEWQGVCRNNSTESTCDATVAVALDTWYRLTVVVAADGSTTDFRINGTSQCQISTNIPTASGRETHWGIVLIKDGSGTGSRTADLDYMEVQSQLATPR